jgi:hypothetical protein
MSSLDDLTKEQKCCDFTAHQMYKSKKVLE